MLGLHIDDETVGRIHRRGLTPAADEVSAQQHQQDQRQQTHRQRADLHHCKGRPRRQLPCSQHQPTWRCGLVDTGAQQAQRRVTGQRKQEHCAGKAAHGNQPELEVAAGSQQERGKTQHTDHQHRQRGRLEVADIAADHAQRRHLGQLQHRRQAKGQHQRQAHAHAKTGRPQRGGRQRGLDQAGQQNHKNIMHRKTQRHAQGAGKQAHQHKLEAVSQCDGALRLAQHAQHGAVVQVLGGKAARHNGHGHRAEQGGQQADEVKEFFSAVQGLPHLGAAAVQRLNAQAARVGFFQRVGSPLQVGLDLAVVTRHSQPVGRAAGRLHQRRGRHICLVHHHTR